MLVGLPRVFLLQTTGIGQHDSHQVRGAGRADDAAAEPLGDEPWQVAAVIDVGVSQDDGVKAPGGNGQRLPVAIPQFLEPLEQPGIDQDTVRARLEQVFRPCDGPRGAEEGQGWHPHIIWRFGSNVIPHHRSGERRHLVIGNDGFSTGRHVRMEQPSGGRLLAN